MFDRTRQKRVTCFRTKVGFEWLLGTEQLTIAELRVAFRHNRRAFEKLASDLYEATASDIQLPADVGSGLRWFSRQ